MITNRFFSCFGIIVLCLLLGINVSCFAFSYSINFTGSGASSTVESVLVQNLTKGISVTVPAGNILTLTDVVTKVDKIKSTSGLISIYPNPIYDNSTLSFYATNAGSTVINAYDLDGKKVAGLNLNIAQGENLFQLSLPKGFYTLQVQGNGFAYNAKALSQSTIINQARITFDGKVTKIKPQIEKAKSIDIEILYSIGDKLLFKGIFGNLSTIITDKPTESKTIDFEFSDCHDADGNYYTIVKIGTKMWMAENLKTTKYRNGDDISTTTSTFISNDASSKYQWVYDNNESNVTTYGRLYTWWAATDARIIAPIGWHVSTDSEWTLLQNYLIANGYNYDGTTIGNKIGKSLATPTLWIPVISPGSVGDDLSKNNCSGFSASPGGYRSYGNETFTSIGTYSTWWCTTQFNTYYAWARMIGGFGSAELFRNNYVKNDGFSVRCVRD